MKIISLYTNDKILIKKATAGNREAQKWLYDTYAPKMLSVCRQYVKDLHFAEDVMVGGFVKVFKHLATFKYEGSFEGWIRRIMVRESITYLRKSQPIVYDDALVDYSSDTHITADSELDVEQIQLLIDALPEGYRIVFVLFSIEGYKHSEIAKMLHISESTSKSQLFKGRKLLQTKLKRLEMVQRSSFWDGQLFS